MKKMLFVLLAFVLFVPFFPVMAEAPPVHTPWDIPLGIDQQEAADFIQKTTGLEFAFNPDGQGPLIITSDLPQVQAVGQPATVLFYFDVDTGSLESLDVYFQEAIDDYASPFNQIVPDDAAGYAVCEEVLSLFHQMTEDYVAAYGPITSGDHLAEGHLDKEAALQDMEVALQQLEEIFTITLDIDNVRLAFECYLDAYDDTHFAFANIYIEYQAN